MPNVRQFGMNYVPGAAPRRGRPTARAAPPAAPPVAPLLRNAPPAAPAAQLVEGKNCRQLKFRNSGNPEFRNSGKPVFDPTPICSPACPRDKSRKPDGSCGCDEGYVPNPVSGNCEPRADCVAPMTLNTATNKCECNAPYVTNPASGKCEAPAQCTPPMTLNKQTNKCECNAPYVTNPASGNCEPRADCVAPMTLNTATNKCECNAPYVTNPASGKCEAPAQCTPPMTLNKQTNKCECKAPNVTINGECQSPATCKANQTLNTATNKCECNHGFKMSGDGENCVRDCDTATHQMINGKCLPKCPDGTNREGELCIPQIDTTKPITITTDVEMGGFEQSDTLKNHGQFTNIKKVIITIDTNEKKVIFKDTETGKEYILYGNIQTIDAMRKTVNSKPITFKTNGLGIKYAGGIGKLINSWDLNILSVELNKRKIGKAQSQSDGIAIKFNKQAEPSKHHPPPVFIYTQGITSYEQDGKPYKSTSKVLEHVLLNALNQPSTSKGGRRKTIKRKRRYSRKLKKHNKKTRKHSKKHTRKHK